MKLRQKRSNLPCSEKFYNSNISEVSVLTETSEVSKYPPSALPSKQAQEVSEGLNELCEKFNHQCYKRGEEIYDNHEFILLSGCALALLFLPSNIINDNPKKRKGK